MSKLEIESECKTLVRWRIDDFSNFTSRNDSETQLNSDDFQLDSSAIKCYLLFYPTWKNLDKNSNYSSLFLCVRDFGGQSSIILRFDLWIENEDGEKSSENFNDEEAIFEISENTAWGCHKFVYHKELYSAKSRFVKNNVVFLCARIIRKGVLPKQPTQFHRNLCASYQTGLIGECTLRLSGEEFKISKTILTAHSEVFKAMFENDLNEKSSGVVEIEDTDSKTMIALIEYMHTETVHNLDENEVALDLFKAADKYLIQELKNLCAENLVKNLNKGNLRERLILAFTYKSKILQAGALEFIANSNNGLFRSIMGSSEWFHFSVMNEESAKEIFDAVCKKLNYTN